MLTKDNNYKVMKLFFDNPEEKFHIRQISRLVGLSHTGVSKIINKLKKEGLLLSQHEHIVENVFASRTDSFFHLKLCHNLISLSKSGLLKFLRDKYEEPEAIIVFGSYSHGEDTSKSDVDIAIVTTKTKALGMNRFEKYLNRKINTYEITIEKCTKEFLNNLANGMVLSGYLRLIK